MEKKDIRDFVPYIMKEKKSNEDLEKAFWAANDPTMKNLSWKYLIDFIDNENDDVVEMIDILTIIGHYIVRFGNEEDGCDPPGKAFKVLSYNEDTPRLFMALLNARDRKSLLEELWRVLYVLRNKVNNLSFQMLLDDLIDFKKDPERVKIRWAKAFYERDSDEAS